jgi:hypothetical protein
MFMGGFAALPGPAGAAAAAAMAVWQQMRRVAEEVDRQAKTGDRLGITVQAMTGLQHAASLTGLSAEGLTAGMHRLNRTIGEAATQGGQAQRAFERLGLDARQLAAAPANEALGQIADRLNTIENPAERSAAAFQIFGRQAAEMGTLLRGGSEGMAAAQRQMDALGLSISRADAAGIEQMNDSITTLRRGFDGIILALTRGLAPVITMVAQGLTRWLEALAPLREAIVSLLRTLGEGPSFLDAFRMPGIPEMLELIATIVGSIVDLFNEIVGFIRDIFSELVDLKGVFEAIGRVIRWITSALRAISGVVTGVVRTVRGWFGGGGGSAAAAASETAAAQRRMAVAVSQASERIAEQTQQLRLQIMAMGVSGRMQQELAQQRAKLAAEMVLEVGPLGPRLAPRFTPAQIQELLRPLEQRLIARQAGELLETLQTQVAQAREQIALFGLSPQEAMLERLRLQLEQVNSDLLAGVNELTAAERRRLEFVREQITANLGVLQMQQQALAVAQRRADLERAGRDVFEQTRNPLEQFQARRRELQEMLSAGAINFDTFSRAAGNAADELERAAGVGEIRAPEALTAGSAQTLSAINRFQREGRQEDRITRLQRVVEEQREIARRQLATQQEMARALLLLSAPRPVAVI